MRRYLPLLIVFAVALITVSSAALLYRSKQRLALTIVNEQKTSGTESGHIRGNPKAQVTLEEFGDFECPPCGKMAEVISQIEKDYQPNLRVIFRNYPLAAHVHAREAAIAAEAAGLQDKFWEMHDLLYREQSVWSKAMNARMLFNAYAGMLGLNLDQFKKDMDGDHAKARVDSDQKQGATIGVQNTPTIFLNNRAIDPKTLNPDGLRSAVDEAVKAQSRSS
jgi:protein-disulfide isomerase